MFKKKFHPELYSEQEQETIENHIMTRFGKYETVLHEIMSPDIHVDICLINPTPERDHRVLVTMGMGAHRMNVPKTLRKSQLDRAEILIALPSEWDIENEDEKWYWPIGWLKTLARLPGVSKTWLGYGHTATNGEPFAENTKLCGSLITMPYHFGNEASTCQMPDGSKVNFYQVVPLYEDEMNYKIENSAEDLENLFPEDFDMVVDIKRKSALNSTPKR